MPSLLQQFANSIAVWIKAASKPKLYIPQAHLWRMHMRIPEYGGPGTWLLIVEGVYTKPQICQMVAALPQTPIPTNGYQIPHPTFDTFNVAVYGAGSAKAPTASWQGSATTLPGKMGC